GRGDRECAVALARGDGAADRPRARAVVRLRPGPARRGRRGAQPPSHDGHATAGDRRAGHARGAGRRDVPAGVGEGPVVGVVFAIVLVMVGVAVALALVRLLRGPTTLDRVVA